MSKLFDKFLTKMLAVIVIIVFIIGFREMILTDDNTATAFGALMGMLPFAEVVTDVICKIMRYQYEIPVISTASVWTDLIRLALMACLQPIIVGLLTAMFLPLPAGMDSYEREVYMDSFRYRAKELLLTIISAPLLALVASWFSAFLFDLLISTFGTPGSILLGALSVIGLSAVSLVPLLVTGTAVGTVIAWRLLVTLGSKMVTTFVTDAFCLAVYVAILGGIQEHIATSIVALVIWLIIMDLGVNALQHAVVGIPKRN